MSDNIFFPLGLDTSAPDALICPHTKPGCHFCHSYLGKILATGANSSDDRHTIYKKLSIAVANISSDEYNANPEAPIAMIILAYCCVALMVSHKDNNLMYTQGKNAKFPVVMMRGKKKEASLFLTCNVFYINKNEILNRFMSNPNAARHAEMYHIIKEFKDPNGRTYYEFTDVFDECIRKVSSLEPTHAAFCTGLFGPVYREDVKYYCTNGKPDFASRGSYDIGRLSVLNSHVADDVARYGTNVSEASGSYDHTTMYESRNTYREGAKTINGIDKKNKVADIEVRPPIGRPRLYNSMGNGAPRAIIDSDDDEPRFRPKLHVEDEEDDFSMPNVDDEEDVDFDSLPMVTEEEEEFDFDSAPMVDEEEEEPKLEIKKEKEEEEDEVQYDDDEDEDEIKAIKAILDNADDEEVNEENDVILK